jgi:hypothetical protein
MVQSSANGNELNAAMTESRDVFARRLKSAVTGPGSMNRAETTVWPKSIDMLAARLFPG